MAKTITIEIPKGKRAEWVNGVLTLIDESNKKSMNVMERVKTFEDACNELGEENEFVQQYKQITKDWAVYEESADFHAYLKLRIITAALNEEWTPQFTEDERRWYPWFTLYTQEEIDAMTEEEKGRVVGRAGGSAYAGGGLVCAFALHVSSCSCTGGGSRLVFRTRELAEYAGKQFGDIWADFVFKVSKDAQQEERV